MVKKSKQQKKAVDPKPEKTPRKKAVRAVLIKATTEEGFEITGTKYRATLEDPEEVRDFATRDEANAWVKERRAERKPSKGRRVVLAMRDKLDKLDESDLKAHEVPLVLKILNAMEELVDGATEEPIEEVG